MVVWVNGHSPLGEHSRPSGDDLVHVHVRLGSAPRLPDGQGEMTVKFAGEDFVGGPADQLSPL